MNIDTYLSRHTNEEDPVLKDLSRETHLKTIHPRMASGHLQGNLLSMLSKIISPTYILEIGTFTAYASICLAKGLKAGGTLHTIEQNDELEDLIRRYIKKSKHEDHIKLHIGDAIKIIPTLHIKFDLIYIDGNKTEYPTYYHAISPLLKKGSVILTDNVLWDNKVLQDATKNDEETKAIQTFNALITQDHSLEKIILPIRDGLFLIRKR